MSRGLFAGFFVFIIMFQSMDRFGMIAYYELNKEYITEMFCVNKSRPELACEGKCFLMKKLQQQDQQDKQIPARVIDGKEIQLFPIHKPHISTLFPEIRSVVPEYTGSLVAWIFVHQVFHPPK